MKILIVGAGPTGLTAGVELARRGVDARIIDRREEGSTLSRAVGINPRSLEILEPSGVTAELLRRGVELRTIHVYREDNRLLSLPLAAAAKKHGRNFILALAQDETEAVLRDAFEREGGTIDYGTELDGLRQNDRQVVATTTTGADLFCDYLIGADGIGSSTREALGIDFPGVELPETWSIADVDVAAWRHPMAATLFQLTEGKVAFVAPLASDRYRVISNTPDALAALPLETDVSKIRREGQFNISIRQVAEYSKGRVFLAGDAAHCHSPVGGRGMNLGIADSADLAERLLAGDLSDYSAERRLEGHQVVAGSERMRKIVTSPHPLTRMLVLTAFKLTSVLPPLQARLATQFLYG